MAKFEGRMANDGGLKGYARGGVKLEWDYWRQYLSREALRALLKICALQDMFALFSCY
jgi:hypothetical protein